MRSPACREVTRASCALHGFLNFPRAPGENNDDLLALDVCQNLEYFSQNLPSAEGTLVESLA